MARGKKSKVQVLNSANQIFRATDSATALLFVSKFQAFVTPDSVVKTYSSNGVSSLQGIRELPTQGQLKNALLFTATLIDEMISGNKEAEQAVNTLTSFLTDYVSVAIENRKTALKAAAVAAASAAGVAIIYQPTEEPSEDNAELATS